MTTESREELMAADRVLKLAVAALDDVAAFPGLSDLAQLQIKCRAVQLVIEAGAVIDGRVSVIETTDPRLDSARS